MEAFRVVDHAEVRLHDRPEDEVSKDVRRYWEHSLDNLRGMRRPVDWRSSISLDLLVELTGPLFIYATTILRIIQNTRTNPIKKLTELLEKSRSGSGSAIAFAGTSKRTVLEELYFYILTEAVKDDDEVSAEYVHQLHDILEVVIFAREPLTPEALSELLRIDADELHNYLVTLSSVFFVPHDTDPDGVIRPLHQSFFDFVLQQAERIHPELRLDSTSAAAHITELCLWQCNELLVSDLVARPDRLISKGLRYACKYWAFHWFELIRAADSVRQVPLGLNDFFNKHLFHWLEVLSLTEGLDVVERVMLEILRAMNVSLAILL
jgi:hypothetical protein